MELEHLPEYDHRRDQRFEVCANTQTAERLCEAINAVAQAHNLHPWFIARHGDLLYVVSHRLWEPTRDERRAAEAYVKRTWPLHPGDIDQANATYVNHLAGQDRYRQEQPASGRRLAERQGQLALGRATRKPRQSRQDAPPAAPIAEVAVLDPAERARRIDALLDDIEISL